MLPESLSKAILMIVSWGYPTYKCIRSVEENKNSADELRRWCQYWLIRATLSIFETLADSYISWVPLYGEMKLAFIVYLLYPQTEGITSVYKVILKPLMDEASLNLYSVMASLKMHPTVEEIAEVANMPFKHQIKVKMKRSKRERHPVPSYLLERRDALSIRSNSMWEHCAELPAMGQSEIAEDISELSVESPEIDQLETGDISAELPEMNHSEIDEMCLFCTLFPQDYEFERAQLYQLWRALASEFLDSHGLIIDGIFDALVNGGYVWKASAGQSKYGVNADKLIAHTMTLMARPLYLRVSRSDCLENAHLELQQLSLESDAIDEEIFNKIGKLKNLKVLLFLGKAGSEIQRSARPVVKIPYYAFSTLKNLRVLDLSGICIAELPSSIGAVRELRYLDLSYSLIELLPETVDCLYRLQTLKLRGCQNLYRLPERIVKLSHLRHLELNILGQLSFLPKRMGELVTLQTLSAFLVDKDDGRRISELKDMNNLRGRFCIAQLERVSDAKDAKVAALVDKEFLSELELRWGAPRSQEGREKQLDYEVLQQLCPPARLKHLQVSGYGGLEFPGWLSDPSLLPTLVSITLVNCENTKCLPCLGEFPFLKVLRLIGIEGVETIDGTFRGHVDIAFPALEELLFVGMSCLETWTEGQIGDFPRLVKLTIEQCDRLTEIPAVSSLDSLKQLEISNCASLSYLSSDQKQLPHSLSMLTIENCPLIALAYHKEHGNNWPLIKHVQSVWIDGEEFIQNNAAQDNT